MEADKTREEEAEVMNWERRNCKWTGSQRGSVGTGPGGEWPEWKYPTGVSAAVPGGAAASPAPHGFGLPWGLEWCLTSIICALWAHLAWGRVVLSLPVCPPEGVSCSWMVWRNLLLPRLVRTPDSEGNVVLGYLGYPRLSGKLLWNSTSLWSTEAQKQKPTPKLSPTQVTARRRSIAQS